MATLKFLASDSASAMEDVVRKLGPDALIISTSKRGNKVEIEATNDKLTLNIKPPKTTKVSPFSEVLHSKIDFLREKQKNRIFSKNAIHTGTSLQRDQFENNQPSKEIGDVKAQIASLQTMLSGMVITDERGVNEKIGHSTVLKLRQMEFSSEIVSNLQPSFEGLSFERGKAAFINAFCNKIAYEEVEEVFGSHTIFLVGPSGSGKTTLAAKIGARILEKMKTGDLSLISTDSLLQHQTDNLAHFAKLLNVPKFKCQIEDGASNVDSLAGGQKIIDVSLTDGYAKSLISSVRNKIGATKVTTILCLPGGANKQLLINQLESYKNLNPLIAFTKLDECELFPRELSVIAEKSMKIGFITGSRSILGSLALAKPQVLSKYLSNCC
jgi:flagellar biosynthesis GTPase FlhF